MTEKTLEHGRHAKESGFFSRLRAKFWPRSATRRPRPVEISDAQDAAEPAPQAPITEPSGEAVDPERATAMEAAKREGLPTEIGDFKLARLSTNKRTFQTLFVFRSDSGGTFVANAKGVRTRAQSAA
ncbi:hypothetical protein ACFL59_15100 [Planctomycetota bacterium]